MSNTWRQRLERIIEERRLNMKELSLQAGLGETSVRDMLKRTRSPSIETLDAVASALGMHLSELLEGEDAGYQRIKVVGTVAAGEGWTPTDEHLDEIEMRVEGGEPIALEVHGASMAPVYREGDLLIGAKRTGKSADNLLGLDCIVVTEDGERYVKFLARGTARGAFNLRSYNPSHKDIENVRLSWAAPILWVKRSQR